MAILGGILLGGRSERMGMPKQLLRLGELTFAEHVAAALRPHCEQLVLLGAGQAPPALEAFSRLADAGGMRGPLAGLLAALLAEPAATWVIAACDLPLVSPPAIAWLISQRGAGWAAVLPRTSSGRVEPLLAVYEPAALPLVQDLVVRGSDAPRELAQYASVHIPTVPAEIAGAWRNLNTNEDYAQVKAAWPDR